ncbi:CHAT domain-containing protein [Micromonospora sp. NPDC049230]|uniref:CHAT domain-containing protein n=1 Tax=Micromonospora sp. NPDC049230 TaxID=3155502 RepID=UPI0033ECFE70
MDGAADITERCVAISRAAFGRGDLDAAVEDLHRLPADLTVRGVLAADLLAALVGGGQTADLRRLRQIDRLLEIAEEAPPATPEWPMVRVAGRVMAVLRAGIEGEDADPRATLAEVDSLLALAPSVGDDPTVAPLFDMMRTMVGLLRAMEDGDEAAMERLPDEARRVREALAENPALTTFGDAFANLTDLVTVHHSGGDFRPAFGLLRETVQRLPAEDPLRASVLSLEPMLMPLAAVLREDVDETGSVVVATDEQLAAMTAVAQRPDLSPGDRAMHYAGIAGTMLGLGEGTDPARVEQAVAHFRTAVDIAPPEDPRLTSHLVGLALGLVTRGEVTGRVSDAVEADEVLGRAKRLAGGPAHPLWSVINELLAQVRRRHAGVADPHAVAVEGLREHSWRVLLQTDLRAANAAARRAAQDAVDVARQCLVFHDPASAIRALDAGRGLALYAATENRQIPGRLEDAGRPDLASRWRTTTASGAAEDAPIDLRREVLTVLTEQSSTGALLDAPTLGEIRAALHTVDADMLVYLVPSTAPVPGYAVIAPAQGPPAYLPLPNLHLFDDLDVERYLTALVRRDAVIADPERDLTALDDPDDPDDFAGSLDVMCDWAWRAAIGPLVQQYLPTLPRPSTGRPPRMILVPMGELARIPWQAARRPDGTYAVRLVAISQAASARMLCHSAALPPVAPTPVGLVVGDPDPGGEAPDLTAARVEAYAIHRSFYPGGRYVGRRPDGSPSRSGPGSADEVRAWLTGANAGVGGMLHLACHGVINTDPAAATSYLLLAGGGRLSAEELVELTSRSPERAIGLIVLAACRTGQAISGYDEAYSLGTAFLAGGVRSVLSTQWAIPDRATSVLMYMFHHHLITKGLPAWEALRQAQSWMLGPDWPIPEGMPEPLRRHLDQDGLSHVTAWAGFVHWGQ